MRRVESNGRRPTAASSWLINVSGDDAFCAARVSSADANNNSASTRRFRLHIFIDQDLKGEAAAAKSFRPRREGTWHAPAACPILLSFPSAREAILTDSLPLLNWDPGALR